MKIINRLLYPFVSVAAVIAASYIASYLFNSNIIAPSPTIVLGEFVKLFSESDFARCVLSTLWRSVYGFLLSFVVALVLAVVANIGEIAEKILYPLTLLARAIPTMSVILLCLLWLRSDKTPVAVSFIIVFPMLYSAILSALKSRDKEIAEMLKVYKVGKVKTFFGYTLPDVALRLYPQFVTTLSFNIKLTISGEAMAYTGHSIGNAMKLANMNFDTAVLLAWTIVAVLLSFAVELFLKLGATAAVKVFNGYKDRKIKQEICR